MIEECSTCRFWFRENFCRRSPPQLITWQSPDYGTQIEQHFPHTSGSEWCGEFKPHPNKEPNDGG